MINLSADVTCQFCDEIGFDYVGLKQHLRMGWCDVFEGIPTFEQYDEQLRTAKIAHAAEYAKNNINNRNPETSLDRIEGEPQQ